MTPKPPTYLHPSFRAKLPETSWPSPGHLSSLVTGPPKKGRQTPPRKIIHKERVPPDGEVGGGCVKRAGYMVDTHELLIFH